MSEQKRFSPLLDGMTLGNPMSEHDGVQCCPAIKENTDKKYIVKTISVPASQVQLDALLLAGAYKDPADAMEYYRQVGERILKEAQLLKQLSKLDGFLPYEGWQMEAITRRRLGYEICLVGSYKLSLEKYLKKHLVTHLEAMNLALDLCAALTVCREAGALYIALKPSNVFVSEKKAYRIGDLGFVEMEALGYTALPEKYQSVYTPPELFDPMASLNMTVDTYALGMLLYQIYNDGQLPFKGKPAPAEVLPSPMNADYELAEIIQKAIHPDPEQRWSDPRELGKALASYMQRNSINDVPITPHTPLDVNPEDIVPVSAEPRETSGDELPAELLHAEDQEPAAQDAVSVDASESAETIPEESGQTVSGSTSAEPAEPAAQDVSFEEDETECETASAELEPENTFFQEISSEVAVILEKAEDLIAHQIPEETGIPEPPDPFSFVSEDFDETPDSVSLEDSTSEDEIYIDAEPEELEKKKKEKKFEDPKYKRRKKRFFSFLLFLLITGMASFAGFWYYQNLYLQTIDALLIDGDREQITITVDTELAEGKLLAVCTDSYGKVETKPISGGSASFTQIQPNTMYTISLQVEGFHKLVGKTSDVYVSDATTRIVSFSSVAGSEDGSVKLNFTVDGEEPNNWILFYSAEGEQEKRKTFSGHSVDISDLTIGKVYTFRLEAGENLSLDGQTTLELLASRLILAENLTITSTDGTDITVHWTAPGDIVVESWDVRCYNDMGYEEKVTVTETEVLFPGIDPAASYTVEVTASGMTQPARTSISANPIHIRALKLDDHRHDKLTVSWEHTGTAPKDGWLVMYSFVGGHKNVVKSTQTQADISPKIPGAKYEISVQAADGTSVFNNVTAYTCPDALPFEKHNLKTEMLEVDLVKTPLDPDWRFDDLDSEMIQTEFAVGDSISIALRSSEHFYQTGAEVDILYVIRDAYGNILPDLVQEEIPYWKDIWAGGDLRNGELLIPAIPKSAGNYELSLYFDGMLVAALPFVIV